MTISIDPNSSSSRIFGVASRVFISIFIVVGAGIAISGAKKVLVAKKSATWPSTAGTIVESSLDRHRSKSSKSGTTMIYRAIVRYQFSVNGAPFVGDRVAFGDYGSSSPSHAQSVLGIYPKGKKVNVYYNPQDPSDCLLEPGAKAQSWFQSIFGVAFMIFSVAMYFISKKGLDRNKRKWQQMGNNDPNQSPWIRQ